MLHILLLFSDYNYGIFNCDKHINFMLITFTFLTRTWKEGQNIVDFYH